MRSLSKKVGLLAILGLTATLFLVGCGGGPPVSPSPTTAAAPNPTTAVTPSPGAPASISVAGSDTMVNLGAAWAEAYMEIHPNVDISVVGGGSGTGIAALINGTTDIAQASRKMKPEEFDQARANGVEPYEIVVAYDGIALAVHPSNPVTSLTFQQLADIFTNRVTDWGDVGGAVGQPIVVLSRDTNSGTHVFFKEHVIQRIYEGGEYGPEVQFMASSQAGVDEVAQNPNAIFYVGLGYISERVRALEIKEDADSPAVYPTIESVSSGEYPLSRPLHFYTNGEPTGAIADYVAFVLGPEGQRIVEELEFVPLP